MSLANDLAPHLPVMRRYARALTGSQESGDAYVVATLEAIIEAPDEFPEALGPKTGLFRVFQRIWKSASVEEALGDSLADGKEGGIRGRLDHLTPPARQAFLLSAMEGFSVDDIAQIMEVDGNQARELLNEAIGEIDRQTTASVLIIEDEPIIAMDLESIVENLGHKVVDVTDTRDTAVAAAKEHRPGLVLADIHLADGSSGIDAVRDILGSFDVPVIFITAYPERLLTGERPEPTYLITKPYNEDGVKATISQALFMHAAA